MRCEEGEQSSEVSHVLKFPLAPWFTPLLEVHGINLAIKWGFFTTREVMMKTFKFFSGFRTKINRAGNTPTRSFPSRSLNFFSSRSHFHFGGIELLHLDLAAR